MRAASTLAASRDNSTMLAPCSAKICAIASPIPIEAPVTTTTFSASSISGFYSGAEAKSRDGAGDGVQSKPLLGLDHQHWRPVTSLLSLFRAETILVEDEAGAAVAGESARAVQLHAEILELAGAVQDLSGADRATISFYLAGSLPLDLDFKQKLLELRSESQRISTLTEYLETILPNVRRAAHARQKAGGNGHAR